MKAKGVFFFNDLLGYFGVFSEQQDFICPVLVVNFCRGLASHLAEAGIT